jgi:hypothetical protein
MRYVGIGSAFRTGARGAILKSGHLAQMNCDESGEEKGMLSERRYFMGFGIEVVSLTLVSGHANILGNNMGQIDV